MSSRLRGFFGKKSGPAEALDYDVETGQAFTVRTAYRYNVTVRKGITTFDDAMEAAQGLKNGDQQILNLCSADPVLRQKIVDFICGVSFAIGGTWEEIGENIFVVAPPSGYVEVAPNAVRLAGTYR